MGVLYERLRGEADLAIELTLLYEHGGGYTNASATPVLRDVTVRDVQLAAREYLTCEGLGDSPISAIALDGVHVHALASKGAVQDCGHCSGNASDTAPHPCFSPAGCPRAERVQFTRP